MSNNRELLDSLILMYVENLNSLRRIESARLTVANFFIAIASGLIGLIIYDEVITKLDVYAAGCIFVLGIYGAIFTIKQWERCYLHLNRTRFLRKKISELYTDDLIVNLFEEADKKHKRRFPVLNKIGLHNFWTSLYALMAILGLSLVVASLLS